MSKEVGPDGSDSPARGSCMFYKLIVASILEDKKLKLPKTFVKKYGDELSPVATFIVPNGHIWLVELQNVNDKIWFQNGWHDFVEYYSIRVGHFLVFRYEGKSNFNVYIFDLTVSEIKYPCDTFSSLQKLGHDGQICSKRHDGQCLLPHKKDDDLTQIMSSGSPWPTPISSRSKASEVYVHCNWIKPRNDGTSIEKLHLKKEIYNLGENFQSSRDIGIQFNGSDLTSTADEVGLLISNKAEGRSRRRKRTTETDKNDQLGVQKADVKSKHKKINSEMCTRRWRDVTAEERQRTIYAADMFRTDNPFCKVILRPSYVYRGFLLHLPSSFVKNHLKGITGYITLQVSDGKQWSVRLVYRDGSAKLSQGWTEFVWENNLEEGDVCVFELINAKDIVLKVAMFRVLEEPAPVNQRLK